MEEPRLLKHEAFDFPNDLIPLMYKYFFPVRISVCFVFVVAERSKVVSSYAIRECCIVDDVFARSSTSDLMSYRRPLLT